MKIDANKTFGLSSATQEMLNVYHELSGICEKIVELQQKHDEMTGCDTETETYGFCSKFRDMQEAYANLCSLFVVNSIIREKDIL